MKEIIGTLKKQTTRHIIFGQLLHSCYIYSRVSLRKNHYRHDKFLRFSHVPRFLCLPLSNTSRTFQMAKSWEVFL